MIADFPAAPDFSRIKARSMEVVYSRRVDGEIVDEPIEVSEIVDIPELDMNDPLVKMAMGCPISMDWIKYKGEVCVGQYNWEESKARGIPMIDLSVCMTQAFNQNIYATVPYEKELFKKHSFRGKRNL